MEQLNNNDAINVNWFLTQAIKTSNYYEISTVVNSLDINENGNIEKGSLLNAMKDKDAHDTANKILQYNHDADMPINKILEELKQEINQLDYLIQLDKSKTKYQFETPEQWQEHLKMPRYESLHKAMKAEHELLMSNSRTEQELPTNQTEDKLITQNSNSINIPNHRGTWYVIDAKSENGKDYFLLEHEEFGDEAACLIVDEKCEVVLEDVWNGFDVLEYYLESQPTITQAKNLADGWQWWDYQDGSGHLDSPQGESYFRYDLSTNEVIRGKNQSWDKFEGNKKDLKTNAENWVSDNIFQKETELENVPNILLESQPTITQAENLAEGWQWHDYIDGCGHLDSPHGESYFSYDLSSNEVQPFEDMAWQKYDGNLKQLKSSAETWIKDLGLNKSIEDVRNEFRNKLSPNGQAEWDKWLLNEKAENQFQELESTKVETPRLFVDMDGTLAVFKPVATLETLYEKGYFESLDPQQNVVDAVKLVIAQRPDVEVFVLSAVLTDNEFAQEEKNAWLDNHLPEINADHRIFVPCGEDKKVFISNLKQSDFLLDDYTKNLTLWQPPATGIKLLNGINNTHGTWQGNMLRHNNSAEIIAQNISKIIEGESIREQPIQNKQPVPLPQGYNLMHEHNDIIMACKNYDAENSNFAIWNINYGRNGVWGGIYFRNDINAAAKSFALKSGMVDENTVFNDDELTEIYKCLQDTSCGEYKISETDKMKIAKIGCKIEQAIPNIQERIYVETNENATSQPQAAQIEAEFEM